MLPTVSLIAINLGYVVAGAITVEVVFNWPGLGTLTVEALKESRLHDPAGHLPGAQRLGGAGKPRRRHDLRPARSEGPIVTAPAATVDVAPLAPPAREASLLRRLVGRPDGLFGLAILVVFVDPGADPGAARRPAARPRSPRPAAGSNRPRSSSRWAPMRSAGASSTYRPRDAGLHGHRLPRHRRSPSSWVA